MKKAGLAAAALLAAAAFLYLNNSPRFSSRPTGEVTILAHRGVAQRFETAGLGNDTCTASRILPPTNPYLENTLASMRAGYAAGADWVEVDIHPTTDGQFAVFHDWTLDCRTDGHGVTREHTLAELKRLDIGHGYTADGGRTFPFRGGHVGQMPSLDEVLAAFPDRGLVINIKSNDPAEGDKLAAALSGLAAPRRARLIVYGGDRPVEQFRRRLPGVRTASRASIKACLLGYIAYGWSGHVPEVCRDRMVLVPINVGPWLWGWPDRMVGRMQAAGALVFVLGPYKGGDFSTGIDTPADVARLPARYRGGVWTNEVEAVAPPLQGRGAR